MIWDALYFIETVKSFFAQIKSYSNKLEATLLKVQIEKIKTHPAIDDFKKHRSCGKVDFSTVLRHADMGIK